MALYFEDLEVGQTFETVGRTITNHEIMTFAGLTGDFNQIHTDDEFARTTPFKERVAHGLMFPGIAMGLTQRLGLFEGTALALLEVTWKFKGAVRMNDTVRCRMTIESKKASSKGDRGVVVRRYELLNQNDEVLHEGSVTVMVRMRGGHAADAG